MSRRSPSRFRPPPPILLLGIAATLLAGCRDLRSAPARSADPAATLAAETTGGAASVPSIPIKQKERIRVTVTGTAAERCVGVAVSGAVSLFRAVGPCDGAEDGTGQAAMSTLAAAAGTVTFATLPDGVGARISAVAGAVQTYAVEVDGVALRVEVLASVTDFGAGGRDTDNDQPALEALINDRRNYASIYFPPGTYHVDNRVLVRRNGLRLWGDVGADGVPAARLFARYRDSLSIIDIEAHDHHRNASARLKHITVERLFFEGRGQRASYGVLIVSSDSVHVRNNHARNLGIAGVMAAGGDPARDVWIEGNVAENDPSNLRPGTHAVMLHWVTGARVRGNRISWVASAIQWWGGGADPKDPRTYDPLRRKRSRKLTIDGNVVRYVSAGIWGSNGDSIRVLGNTVQSCQDVCLDAEGSRNVLFEGNTARYAGQSVLASFYYSTGIVFRNNTVEQDGTRHDVDGIRGARTPWQGMFMGVGHNQDQDSITTRLVGNRFIFTPAGRGVGRLHKESSRFMAVDSNTMLNTVVEMAENNNGVVQVTGNTLRFTRSTDTLPAIRVGSNHNAPGLPAGSASIMGNVVESSVPQRGAGIEAWQWAWDPPVTTSIQGNQVTGFATSILYRNDSREHVWRITGNRHDGRIARSGNAAPRANVAGNSYTGPAGQPPPCRPGTVCHPP